MPDEVQRKALVLDYFKRVNSGDVDAICRLFSPAATIEDPVGTPAVVGEDAVRAYFHRLVEDYQTNDEPGTPTGSQDESHVAIPLRATVRNVGNPGPERLAVNVISVFRIGQDGLIEEMRAFWGATDVAPAS